MSEKLTNICDIVDDFFDKGAGQDPNYFQEEARRQEIGTIVDFCQRPPASGGVLLVSGPRGSGKSRLVDAALSQEKRHWGTALLSRVGYMFGDGGRRSRRLVLRSPRTVHRHLIKVDVDPYFPHSSPNSDDAAPDPGISSKERRHLLVNVVFALTSTLDPRAGMRRSGRTLRSRLGFFGYWLSPRAISWPDSQVARIFLWLILASLFSAEAYVIGKPFGANFSATVGVPMGFAAAASIFGLAWALLRHLDWMAVARMSNRLYDLAHGEETNQANQRTVESGFSLKRDWDLGAGIAMVAGGLMFGLQQQVGAAPQHAVLSPEWVSVLFGGLLLAVHYSSRHKEELHTNFGNDNVAWLITLLRRYLFLLHRCGVEPVLVVEELDKLESEGAAKEKSVPLNRFLESLTTLKQSLGADFLWILVGGPGLYQEVQGSRDHGGGVMMRRLGTVIQQEVVIGPVSIVFAEEFFLKLAPNKAGEFRQLWLASGGIYAGMYRLVQQAQNGGISHLDATELIAHAIEALWEPASQADIMGLSATQSASHSQALLSRDWSQVWLHVGMIRFANELLIPRPRRLLTHQEFEARLMGRLREENDRYTDEKAALLVGSPELLALLGEKLLYGFLRYCHDSGPDKRFRFGIPDTGATGDLRLEVPEGEEAMEAWTTWFAARQQQPNEAPGGVT